METKKSVILAIFFAFLISTITPWSLVFAQNSTTTPENPSNLPSPLEQYSVEPEFKGLFAKLLEKWRPINEQGTGFWSKSVWPFLVKWANRVEVNIREGLVEEKQEYKQEFFETLGTAWEKIKNFVLHR